MKYTIFQGHLPEGTPQTVLLEQAMAMLCDEDAAVRYAQEHFNELYVEVYTGITEDRPIMEALASLHRILNVNHPEDYHARSLSAGDVVYLESDLVSAFYVVTAFGFKLLPIVRNRLEKALGDGTTLSAVLLNEAEYPGIRISLHKPDGTEENLCFAELNSGKPAGMQLYIGAYAQNINEPAYYECYYTPGTPSPNN